MPQMKKSVEDEVPYQIGYLLDIGVDSNNITVRVILSKLRRW